MLEKIKKPNDVKKIPAERLPELAEEIRGFLIESLSRTGGHLASNLGVVELTIALHRVYTLPEDKIIWDVGHQAYTHKILTGRKEDFGCLRQAGGISGFPRRDESPCDALDTGHSSTSLSAALGYVRARDLKKQRYHVAAVIGDGALTGGMAYEAMNNAAELKTNLVIVLNDNEMSISRNVGGISNYLADVRTSSAYTGFKMGLTSALEKIPGIGKGVVDTLRKTKSSIKQLVIPGMFFENMGLTYLGPVNGHNIRQLMKVLAEAKRFEGPVLVHVLTEKGRGYGPAARHPARFHGTAPFEIETGIPSKRGGPTYTDIFSTVMRKMGDREPDVVAVTAAMEAGTGLKRFANLFPGRFFDVGIAEQHAVTFAAGLALGGLVPVVAVYSSFLQRAYDQVLEDVCLQKLHVVFALDRAGLVGADGKTHQGLFDLSYLTQMPGMTVMAPKNLWELSDMMKFAVHFHGPIAVRYPRGEACREFQGQRAPVELGRAEILEKGSRVAFLAVGAMVPEAAKAVELLRERTGIRATLVNVRFVKPFDRELLRQLSGDHAFFVTMEENVETGGFGQQVQVFADQEHLPVSVCIAAAPDQFVGHGTTAQQREWCGLDAASVTRRILERLKPEKTADSGRIE